MVNTPKFYPEAEMSGFLILGKIQDKLDLLVLGFWRIHSYSPKKHMHTIHYWRKQLQAQKKELREREREDPRDDIIHEGNRAMAVSATVRSALKLYQKHPPHIPPLSIYLLLSFTQKCLTCLHALLRLEGWVRNRGAKEKGRVTREPDQNIWDIWAGPGPGPGPGPQSV